MLKAAEPTNQLEAPCSAQCLSSPCSTRFLGLPSLWWEQSPMGLKLICSHRTLNEVQTKVQGWEEDMPPHDPLLLMGQFILRSLQDPKATFWGPRSLSLWWAIQDFPIRVHSPEGPFLVQGLCSFLYHFIPQQPKEASVTAGLLETRKLWPTK